MNLHTPLMHSIAVTSCAKHSRCLGQPVYLWVWESAGLTLFLTCVRLDTTHSQEQRPRCALQTSPQHYSHPHRNR
jgi:hypothetical protein